jgi:protocatechuate 3,4-dioxygenase beta subunit
MNTEPASRRVPGSRHRVFILAILVFGIAGLIFWKKGKQEPTDSRAPAQTSTDAAAPAPAEPAPVERAADSSAPSTAVVPLSLAKLLEGTENEDWRTAEAWKALPNGTQFFGGIEFHLQGVVLLQGKGAADMGMEYRPDIVLPLPKLAGRTFATLHVVGGTRYNAEAGTTFADVIWHYTDGSIKQTPLQYNVHLRDWWRTPFEEPAKLPFEFVSLAWKKANSPAAVSGKTLRLYRLSLENPDPTNHIKELEFTSTMQRPSLFFLALTLDPLKPGERPDDSPLAEDTDVATARKSIQVTVLDSDGRPLEQAKVGIQLRKSSGPPLSGFTRSFFTGPNGVSDVQFPDAAFDSLAIIASKENYGSRRMTWNTPAGDVVPSNYTLKLPAGITIGGFVVDQDGNPIGAATLKLNRFWSGDDLPERPHGEDADFPNQIQYSDVNGHWEASGLPAELIGKIMLEATHPNFPPTNITIGSNAGIEQELRAGTYKLKLRRGLVVHGRVVDQDDKPVANAAVWAGKRFFRDRQRATSDANGNFAFYNLSAGDVFFSASAKNHAAFSKSFPVADGMKELVLRLGPASVIRATVQNEAGEPLPGVFVGLENSPGGGNYDAIEFSATTDADGKFEWDSAPPQAETFYLGLTGYEEKRDARLEPNQDNVVTLRRSRQLQGTVVDADTGDPVTQFTVRTGKRAGGDSTEVYGIVEYHDFAAADGKFTLPVKQEQDDAAQVSGKDYLPQVESFPAAEDGIIRVTFRLKRSDALSGTVVLPDGTPAAGVTVAAVPSGPDHLALQLANGRIRSYGPRKQVATSDGEGHFEISAPPPEGTVVAAGDAGFGTAAIAQIRAGNPVVLQAYGRIEGSLFIGGEPGRGLDLLYTLTDRGLSTDFEGYKSTTDDQGHFTIEKIPPGKGSIVRLVQTQPNSWTWSHGTDVIVEPGKTTRVTLGTSGALLHGHARFENAPDESESLVLSGSLNETGPTIPQGLSSDELQALISSPGWRDQNRQLHRYTAKVNADGTFTFDSIAPGSYTLDVTATKTGENAWQHPPVATGQIKITIPPGSEPSAPISLDEVILRPPANPHPPMR